MIAAYQRDFFTQAQAKQAGWLCAKGCFFFTCCFRAAIIE